MKKELLRLTIRNCKKAIIKLKNESTDSFLFDRSLHFIAFNNFDCFDIHIKGEDDNYCFFYKNVTSVEVLE